jgi:DNA-binding response OmpR family regulator
MIQKILADVCVISDNPVFNKRVKIYSQNSDINFVFLNFPVKKSPGSIVLIDFALLNLFLKVRSDSDKTSFIVHGENKDLALSYNAGCTDFLKNPWYQDELEARLYKIIGYNKSIIYWDKLTLSNQTLRAANHSLKLGTEEYYILRKLLEQRGEPVPREVLMFVLWGKYKSESRVVDMHIANLRKKIRSLKEINQFFCGDIKTIRNFGYMII